MLSRLRFLLFLLGTSVERINTTTNTHTLHKSSCIKPSRLGPRLYKDNRNIISNFYRDILVDAFKFICSFSALVRVQCLNEVVSFYSCFCSSSVHKWRHNSQQFRCRSYPSKGHQLRSIWTTLDPSLLEIGSTTLTLSALVHFRCDAE